jgi:hypothetical protein
MNWAGFGAHAMKQQLLLKKTKQQSTKIPTKLKQKPSSPQFALNDSQTKKCMDLIVLSPIKVKKGKSGLLGCQMQLRSKCKPPTPKTLRSYTPP